ncbi:uncharacterized protein [Nicotiana sylvestris]|uniref:uncharacterized protein n=1 Tax=Nicotiana sylvestris TaxID=4096 RepID=UPI00388CDDF6
MLEDALRLRMFPFSLRGKALDLLERLPNHSITMWDELANKFTTKFFSPGHMTALKDGILAFKQEPNKPLHENRYRNMVNECPNNDMTEAMIQQIFYRGINTTNQCVVNQLAGGNFMKLPYAEACDILDEMADTSSAWQSRANVPQGDLHVINFHKELQDHGQAIAELTIIMNQLAKAQLQQIQGSKQQGPSSSNNEMGWIESMFEQMMKKNADFDAQLASHNTSIRNLEVQLGQISQALNTRPKGSLPSDTVVNLKSGNNTDHAMDVTTRSGKGGEARTSKQKKL